MEAHKVIAILLGALFAGAIPEAKCMQKTQHFDYTLETVFNAWKPLFKTSLINEKTGKIVSGYTSEYKPENINEFGTVGLQKHIKTASEELIKYALTDEGKELPRSSVVIVTGISVPQYSGLIEKNPNPPIVTGLKNIISNFKNIVLEQFKKQVFLPIEATITPHETNDLKLFIESNKANETILFSNTPEGHSKAYWELICFINNHYADEDNISLRIHEKNIKSLS